MDKLNKDGFTKEELKILLPYAKGLNKELLDADTALKNNSIATKMLRKLKYENLMHIIFLFLGCFITFLFTNILGADNRKETITEIHKLKTEINVLKSDFQTRLYEQSLIIHELENQLTTQKQLLDKQ